MIRLQIVTFIVLMASFVSCASKKNTQENSNVQPASAEKEVSVANEDEAPMISLQTTSCRHRCPVYLLEIMDNGEAVIYGQKFFKVDGKATAKLSKEQLKMLNDKVSASNFYTLEDVYDNDKVQDIPALFITGNKDGKTKSIKSRYHAPENLVALQSYLQDLANVLDWKK